MINLSKDEYVVYEVNRHWFRMLFWFISISVTALVSLTIFIFFVYRLSVSGTISDIYFLSFLFSLWLVFLWIILFIEWTDYSLDVWVITNKRILDIDQQGLLRRDVASVEIQNVQDVKVTVNGILAMFFKVGDIHLQTAGVQKEFVLKDAKNAEKVREVIFNLLQDIKTK